MSNEIQTNQPPVALYKALAKFQQTCPSIMKGSTAKVTSKDGQSNYAYKYADINAIIGIITPIMADCGLGFTQLLSESDNGMLMTTVVFEIETGQSISSTIKIPVIKFVGQNDAQSAGSVITYYRRYALGAILGIVTEKDTDAAGVQQAKTNARNEREAEVREAWMNLVNGCSSIEELNNRYKGNISAIEENDDIKKLFSNRKKQLQADQKQA